jgi:nicotinate-nucleotide pyrophosphorylase (carboxylating)
MIIPVETVNPLLKRALAEDIGTGDLTTQATVDPEHRSSGGLRAKESGVVSGLCIAQAVFEEIDPETTFTAMVNDGDVVASGKLIGQVRGRTHSLLTAERTALNFLQHFSGIATRTARFVALASPRGVKILDTRKTTPGLRKLEKAAVVDGGGVNHRIGLYDAVLIKDNHLDAAGGIEAVFTCFAEIYPLGLNVPVIVEVRDLDELKMALTFPIDRVLLDNFTPELVTRAIAIVKEANLDLARQIAIEVSGGITLETVVAYAQRGVDYISVGSLTHSAPALDISLTLEPDHSGHD